MKILVATNNPSKVARVRQLLAGRDVVILTPTDLGIAVLDVEEGSDIAENAERKARSYLGKTDFPILGMDSAFVIPNEDMDPSKVRRNALRGLDEAEMRQEEIADAVIAFYKKIAERAGGRVSSYWDDAFALVMSDGSIRRERSHRPVILTTEVRGAIDPFFPLRSLYIVEPTGKYVAEQNEEEEKLEMLPYQEGLERILGLQRI